MSNKKIVICSFIAYVVITSLHRLLDNYYLSIDLFCYVDKTQDIQYYVKDTLGIVGFSIILYALHRIAGRGLRFITGIFLLNSIIQVPLYFLFYLHYDIIINFVILVIVLIKIRFDEKRAYNR